MPDNAGPAQPPLNGWKEIAAHLGKSVRSVQRWEATLGLPVRRIRTPDGQIVYAERDEIDEWRRALDAPPPPEPEDPADPESLPEDRADPESLPETPAPPSPVTAAPPSVVRRYARSALAAAALFAAGLLAGWGLFRPSPLAVSVALTGQSLHGLNAGGAVVWSYSFGEDVSEPASARGTIKVSPRAIDLDGDGRSDWLVPVRFTSGASPSTSDAVFAFADFGTLKWSFRPDQTLTYPNRTMSAPWLLMALTTSPGPAGRVWAGFVHHIGGSSFVLEITSTGSSSLRYVQFGRINALLHWNTPAGGVLAVGGTSDEHRRATLVLMSEGDPPATYPIANPQRPTCSECPPGLPSRMFLFPLSELGIAAHDMSPGVIGLQAVGHLLRARTSEGEGLATFEFNPDFKPAGWQFEQSYWGVHRELEQKGKLDHLADACPDRLSAKGIREWTSGSGWHELVVPPGPARLPVAAGLAPWDPGTRR